MDFSQVEAEYARLKGQFEAGSLTEEQFKSQLHDLMLQDEAGEWWVIGYETGQWYRHDGTDWVRADPPGRVLHDITSPPDTRPESISSKPLKEPKKLGFMKWNPVVLISLSWGVIWGITWSIPWLFELGYIIDEGGGFIIAILCAVLSGLVCGLVLQWNSLPLRWHHIIVIGAGWAVGWTIGLTVDVNLVWRVIIWDEPIGINEIINLVIIGSIGGFATGLTLKWADLYIDWKQVIIIAGGWILAVLLGLMLTVRIILPSELLSIFARFAITGLIVGALGSAIMFWQLGQLKKTE